MSTHLTEALLGRREALQAEQRKLDDQSKRIKDERKLIDQHLDLLGVATGDAATRQFELRLEAEETRRSRR
jgi:hypothetical protein